MIESFLLSFEKKLAEESRAYYGSPGTNNVPGSPYPSPSPSTSTSTANSTVHSNATSRPTSDNMERTDHNEDSETTDTEESIGKELTEAERTTLNHLVEGSARLTLVDTRRDQRRRKETRGIKVKPIVLDKSIEFPENWNEEILNQSSTATSVGSGRYSDKIQNFKVFSKSPTSPSSYTKSVSLPPSTPPPPIPVKKPLVEVEKRESLPKQPQTATAASTTLDLESSGGFPPERLRKHQKSVSNPNFSSVVRDHSMSTSDSRYKKHRNHHDLPPKPLEPPPVPPKPQPHPPSPQPHPPSTTFALPPENSTSPASPASLEPNTSTQEHTDKDQENTEVSSAISPRLSVGKSQRSIKAKIKSKMMKSGSSATLPKRIPDTQNLSPAKDSPLSPVSKNRPRPDKFMRRTTRQQEELFREREIEMSSIDEIFKADWHINIWTGNSSDNIIVKEDEESKKVTVEAGTLNGLVRRLTSIGDHAYMKTFLMTYKSFATPLILLKKLKQSHYPPKEIELSDPALVKGVQIRTVNVIVHWLELAPQDWDSQLVKKLDKLINQLKENNSPLVVKMENKLIDVLEGIEKRIEARILVEPPPPRIPKDLEGKVGVDFLISLDPLEAARQITLLDWVYFSKFESFELLNGAWNNKKYKHRARNVLAMIHNFNQRANWVAKFIVSQTQFKKRIKTFSRLLQIATKLLEMNNFSSSLAFYSAFENSACYRLNHTRNAVLNKKNGLGRLNALQHLADTSFNYKNYREALKKATPPILPHLGVFLTDLTFIEELPEVINERLINFKKRQLCYEVISGIRQYQLIPFNFTPVPTLQEFLSVEHLEIVSEKELFDLSLTAEPRGWAPESLINL